MSKISVTTIAGLTSGGDANKVIIESGDTLQVDSNATVGGTLGVTGVSTLSGNATVGGTLGVTGATTLSSNLTVDGGTIKLDGNFPTAGHNVALGNGALSSGSLSGSNNVAIGSNTLASNTSGAQNIGIGRNTLDSNTDGMHNTGIGHAVLTANVSGGGNVGIGRDSLSNNTASHNTAVGYQSLITNTSGANGTAIGMDALKLNTTGSNNTAVGSVALDANTTGTANVALGRASLTTNTTGSQNVGIGVSALEANLTDGYNTSVGNNSLAATTGSYNTGIGYGVGSAMTSGNRNTFIGCYNGNQGSLDLRTSSNNIVLSDGAGNPRLHINASAQFRFPATAPVNGEANFYSQSNWAISTARPSSASAGMINFYNGSTYVGGITTSTSATQYNTSSDYRLKENVDYSFDATTRLKQLKPCRFNFISDEKNTLVDGFLAHEVSNIIPEAITGEKDAVDDDGNPIVQGIDQAKLVPLLTKTLQEALTEIDTLKTKVAVLESA